MNNQDNPTLLATTIAEFFSAVPEVSAVALGGSTAHQTTTPSSDIDLYIFTTKTIPLEIRSAIVHRRGAIGSNLNLNFWDLGDQWFDAPTGIEVDVMYWDTRWIEDQIDHILIHHQASLGYSTCHWHTIKNSVPLFDRHGWFASLQAKCSQPYPKLLQVSVISKNFPVLGDVIPSYANQIKKAVARNDRVSLYHRVAAFLASYFDILFALNCIPHPGEKRLLQLTPLLCKQLPERMESQVNHLLDAANQGSDEVIVAVGNLIENLQLLLEKTNFALSKRT